MTFYERRKPGDRRQVRASDDDDLHYRLKEKFEKVEFERRQYLRRQTDPAGPEEIAIPTIPSEPQVQVPEQLEQRGGQERRRARRY